MITQQTASASNTIDYLASNGNRKVLWKYSKNPKVAAVQEESIATLRSYICLVCLDVHEKSVQSRCCESILCVMCYLTLPEPKQCPGCRKNFFRNLPDGIQSLNPVTKNLMPAGRLVNNQIEQLISHFTDIGVTTNEADKKSAAEQIQFLEQIKSENIQGNQPGSAKPENQQPDTANTLSSRYTAVRDNAQTTTCPPIGATAISSRHHKGVFADFFNFFTLTSGKTSRITDRGKTTGNLACINSQADRNHVTVGRRETLEGTRVSGGQPRSLQAGHHGYRDYSVEMLSSLNVRTVSGNIVLKKHDHRNQGFVSIKASSAPEIQGKTLSVKDISGDINLKIPTDFNKPIEIKTISGNINASKNCIIKTGGRIKTISGDVKIRVDANLVKVRCKTCSGHLQIPGNHHGKQQTDLLVSTTSGNINIFE